MVSKTHTMTLGKPKNSISQIIGTSFAPKQKYNYFFDVIATKPIEILFKQTINNIK